MKKITIGIESIVNLGNYENVKIQFSEEHEIKGSNLEEKREEVFENLLQMVKAKRKYLTKKKNKL